MAKLVRKNVFLDPVALRKAQKILRQPNESEAIREALRMVSFRKEVLERFDRVAGRAPQFRDIWENDRG